jgi:hypothetical protein
MWFMLGNETTQGLVLRSCVIASRLNTRELPYWRIYAHVLAICNRCGTAFPSGIFIENSSNVTLSGNTAGPCPKCGGIGNVPDGLFNFVGETIEVLSAPIRTYDELARLNLIVRQARAHNQSPQFVISRIEDEIPSLSNLIKWPQNRSELYAFLALIIALLTLILPFMQSQQKTPEISIEKVIETYLKIQNENQQDTSHLPQNNSAKRRIVKAAPKVKVTGKTSKPSRNAPCTCGSGQKYKRCCGKK